MSNHHQQQRRQPQQQEETSSSSCLAVVVSPPQQQQQQQQQRPFIVYKLLEDLVERDDQYSQGTHVLKYAAYNENNDNNEPITIHEWIQYMIDDEYYEDMSLELTNVIKDCPFDGIRFETKGITYDTSKIQQFEFVLIKDDRLADFATYSDEYTFADQLAAITNNQYGGSFSNLGGDAMLVCPKNFQQQDKNRYGHLAVFVRKAPTKQIQEMWKLVSETYRQELDKQSPKPIWFSTAGGGIRWLHFRFDTYPKYYRYQPYKKQQF